jgi:hypothetical protein
VDGRRIAAPTTTTGRTETSALGRCVTSAILSSPLLIPALLVIMASVIWFYSPENVRKELNEIAV